MTNRRPTVFLVDDDPDVLKSVGRLLRANQFDTHEFACARDLLAHFHPDGDACLVLDVNLPDLDGLRLHEQIAEQQGPPVVFITGHANIPMSVRAMKHGAVDFLQKPFTEESLLAAIDVALQRHHESRIEHEELANIRVRFERLTTREREVMLHVVSGKLNKQIAFDLGVAEKTVKVHRGRVMEKMEIVSVAELVHQAHWLGLCRNRSASAPAGSKDTIEFECDRPREAVSSR